MKLVDPTDPDLVRVMLAAQAKVKAGGRMIPMNDAGKAELLAVIEQTAAELCPLRRFLFRIETYPGLGVANIIIEEPEPGDIQ